MRLLWRRSRGPRPKHRGEKAILANAGSLQPGAHKIVGTEVTHQQGGDGGKPKQGLVADPLTGGGAVCEHVRVVR